VVSAALRITDWASPQNQRQKSSSDGERFHIRGMWAAISLVIELTSCRLRLSVIREE
jgi:hypothetical protein